MSNVKFNGNPVWEVDRIINNIFNDFPRNWNGSSQNNLFHPAVNIYETADEYLVELNAPGRKKEDFQIKVENGMLRIGYENKEEKTVEGKKTIRREFTYKSFQRSFQLDENIETDAIVAKYESGVLQIALPKKADVKEKSKNISIQ